MRLITLHRKKLFFQKESNVLFFFESLNKNCFLFNKKVGVIQRDGRVSCSGHLLVRTLVEIYALKSNKSTLIHDVDVDKGSSTFIDNLI
jgi:hypothetical protein